MAFLTAIVFLPLFMVNVVGLTATSSGLTTTPLTFGIVAGNVFSGQLVSRSGRYKPLMLIALVILIVAFAVMGFTLSPHSTQAEVTVKMILIGLGLGPSIPLYTLAIQNAVPAAADRRGHLDRDVLPPDGLDDRDRALGHRLRDHARERDEHRDLRRDRERPSGDARAAPRRSGRFGRGGRRSPRVDALRRRRDQAEGRRPLRAAEADRHRRLARQRPAGGEGGLREPLRRRAAPGARDRARRLPRSSRPRSAAPSRGSSSPASARSRRSTRSARR